MSRCRVAILPRALGRAITPQLRQYPRKVDSLHLSAAQRLIIAITEFRDVKVRHDLVDDLFVVWAGTSAEVRISSHHDDFTHVEWKGNFNRLRKDCATFSKFSFAGIANAGAIVFDLAGLRMQ